MTARETRIGRFRLIALHDADFALDGGAMFGVVPRALWQRLTPVNEDHTIPLASTPFLLDDGEHRILIEPGMGRRWGEKQVKMFHIDHSKGHDLIESLRAAGVEPEEVTHCLMSHCHWDHIGAACGEDGRPVFPNAEYWCPEVERQALHSQGHMRGASYRVEDLQPIEEAGLLQTFAGTKRIVPGVTMVELGGHSEGTSLITVESEGEKAGYWADIVPTRNHVHLPFIMAYDMNAEKSFAVRSEWIARAAAEGWMNMLYHDPISPLGRFQHDGKRYVFDALT
ncbi:MAG: MBL fold metallo-hydrolase [Planctomycetota bacterium]|jgi:glyoxylase-like metal-dependent hydrolase (beta-lactamase superfamily II)